MRIVSVSPPRLLERHGVLGDQATKLGELTRVQLDEQAAPVPAHGVLAQDDFAVPRLTWQTVPLPSPSCHSFRTPAGLRRSAARPERRTRTAPAARTSYVRGRSGMGGSVMVRPWGLRSPIGVRAVRRHHRNLRFTLDHPLRQPLEPFEERLAPANSPFLHDVALELAPRQQHRAAHEILDECDVELAPVDEDPEALPGRSSSRRCGSCHRGAAFRPRPGTDRGPGRTRSAAPWRSPAYGSGAGSRSRPRARERDAPGSSCTIVNSAPATNVAVAIACRITEVVTRGFYGILPTCHILDLSRRHSAGPAPDARCGPLPASPSQPSPPRSFCPRPGPSGPSRGRRTLRLDRRYRPDRGARARSRFLLAGGWALPGKQGPLIAYRGELYGGIVTYDGALLLDPATAVSEMTGYFGTTQTAQLRWRWAGTVDDRRRDGIRDLGTPPEQLAGGDVPNLVSAARRGARCQRPTPVRGRRRCPLHAERERGDPHQYSGAVFDVELEPRWTRTPTCTPAIGSRRT